ncbi:threonine synthase [Jeotgalibaca dankookensis]|uniref:threonine synthase n=1 Tax=Jeotgalibaca dankookensis TaxID=708126 RepID=UPI001F20F40E
MLTVTSGDTRKAALDGFSNVPGTRIIFFYPKDGVSEFQERQMLTQSGHNVSVIAVEGNFDEAQNEVKNLFVDEKLKKELTENNLIFSSANSINIGRLIPQIVYYIHTYGKLLNDKRIQAGDFMNVTIPTGNFGNILAAYYAQQMGLPIKKLIVASNENNVLSDFFHSGIYNRKREFIRTHSPSMDILVSSNLERLLYHLSNNTDTVKNYMTALSNDGFYEVTAEIIAKAKDFYADFASEIDVLQEIKRVFDETGYLLDPHTAVASIVAEKHNDHLPMIIAATASLYKFPKTVLTALDVDLKSSTLESALLHLAKLNKQTLPLSVEKALYDDFLHHTSIPISKMKQAVLEKLNL